MKQSPLQHYAIWLIPAQPDQEELQQQILTLSQRTSSICFSPHLTLFAGVDKPLSILQAAVETICQDVSPLTLISTGLKVSPTFFQTLFVVFAPHPSLSALAEQFRKKLASNRVRPFHPHLSLLYHNLPLPEKEALQAKMIWKPPPIRFDAVSIVLPPAGERGWYDIAGWKTVFLQTLRSENT